ncbi:hypothetical protein GCM10010378_59450 [Streptomyces viridochromogenes]
MVGLASDDPDTIVVPEAWESKDHHDASLPLPEAEEAIAAAMPMPTGEFTIRELVVAGGAASAADRPVSPGRVGRRAGGTRPGPRCRRRGDRRRR